MEVGGSNPGWGGSGWIYTEYDYMRWLELNSADANQYLLNSNYYLENATTIAGDSSFPAPGEGTETGHSGNGYARITCIASVVSDGLSIEIENQLYYGDERCTISDVKGGDIELSARVNLTGNIDYTKTKYVFVPTSYPIGTDEVLYTDGKINYASSVITQPKAKGKYYLHVLMVNNSGEKKEVISINSVDSQGGKSFSYSGSMQSINLLPGKYRLEVWGAQGGTSYGGKGGYSVGEITLLDTTLLNVYVGQQGDNGYNTTAFNGGGKGYGSGATTENSNTNNRGGGGGATDIRINSTSLYARVIVAGGRRWRL